MFLHPQNSPIWTANALVSFEIVLAPKEDTSNDLNYNWDWDSKHSQFNTEYSRKKSSFVDLLCVFSHSFLFHGKIAHCWMYLFCFSDLSPQEVSHFVSLQCFRFVNETMPTVLMKLFYSIKELLLQPKKRGEIKHETKSRKRRERCLYQSHQTEWVIFHLTEEFFMLVCLSSWFRDFVG